MVEIIYLPAMVGVNDKSKIQSLWLTLSFSFLLMAVKFAAYYFTHSNAILTDAMESIINIVAGSFALYSIYYASKPKDADHPYGHGKIEYLSAGFEGGLIFIAGIYIIAKALYNYFHPIEIHSLDVGIYLSVFAGAINYIMGNYLIKRGKKFDSVLMVADGKHLISDTISSAGVVIGLAVIYFTQLYWLDNIVAAILGAFIFYTGYTLVKESITGLLDEADSGKIDQLISILNKNRMDKWIDIHNLRILKYGSHLHVDCHLTLPWYDSLEEAHNQVSLVEQLIRKDLGGEVEFFIHSDPCVPPSSCEVCQLKDCKVRKAEFKVKLEWTMENMLPDKKHKLS
jgi:cation diffusion facilitator family transporter